MHESLNYDLNFSHLENVFKRLVTEGTSLQAYYKKAFTFTNSYEA